MTPMCLGILLGVVAFLTPGNCGNFLLVEVSDNQPIEENTQISSNGSVALDHIGMS